MNASALDARYVRARRRSVAIGVLLLLLLAASAYGARLHLGAGNLALSLGIAALKLALVGWFFMELGRRGALPRLAVAAGLGALAVFGALGLVDLLPRHDEPAAWQAPQALPPRLEQAHPASSADVRAVPSASVR